MSASLAVSFFLGSRPLQFTHMHDVTSNELMSWQKGSKGKGAKDIESSKGSHDTEGWKKGSKGKGKKDRANEKCICAATTPGECDAYQRGFSKGICEGYHWLVWPYDPTRVFDLAGHQNTCTNITLFDLMGTVIGYNADEDRDNVRCICDAKTPGECHAFQIGYNHGLREGYSWHVHAELGWHEYKSNNCISNTLYAVIEGTSAEEEKASPEKRKGEPRPTKGKGCGKGPKSNLQIFKRRGFAFNTWK